MQTLLLNFAIILFMVTTQVHAAKDEGKSLTYISLGDAMVLNLQSNNGRLTFLQIKADVLIKDSSSEELIKAHIPAIRHQLIVLLSEKPASDMKSSVKREEIRSVATARVRELMIELGSDDDISDVLFSSVLVQ